MGARSTACYQEDMESMSPSPSRFGPLAAGEGKILKQVAQLNARRGTRGRR
jgi:hypothetical protein